MRWSPAWILRSCACLGIVVASPARAASFASYLADLGLAEEAAAELDRADLLDPDAGFDAQQGPGLGMRLLAQGHSAAAARVLQRAVDRTQDLGLLRLSLGVALLQTGRYPQAVHEFGRLEAFAARPEERLRAHRFRCIAHLHAVDAVPAGRCVRQLLGTQMDPSDLADLAVDPQALARWGGVLSALVPGLGQATAGQWGDAGGAILVNGAWSFGVAELLLEHAPVDAALLGLGVGIRYYVGNIQHGAHAWQGAAEQRRADAARRLLTRVAELPP